MEIFSKMMVLLQTRHVAFANSFRIRLNNIQNFVTGISHL